MKIIFSLCNQTFITSKRSWLPGLKAYQHTHCELEQDYKISNILQFTVKYSTYNSILRYFSLHKELLLLSVDGFNRCPSYREYSYSKKTENWQGPTPGVGLREASVEKELTVQDYYKL